MVLNKIIIAFIILFCSTLFSSCTEDVDCFESEWKTASVINFPSYNEGCGPRHKHAIVVVDSENNYHIGKSSIIHQLGELEVAIQKHVAIHKDSTVELYCDSKSIFKSTSDVVLICQKNNFNFILKFREEMNFIK